MTTLLEINHECFPKTESHSSEKKKKVKKRKKPTLDSIVVDIKPVSVLELGISYFKGDGIEQNNKLAKKCFTIAILRDTSSINSAYYFLALTYLSGDKLTQDVDIAIRCFAICVDNKKDPKAAFNIGSIYYNGMDLPVNYELAMAWYKHSAEYKYALAEYCVAVMYDMGQGVNINYPEAIKWFQRSAAQNHEQSQYILGNAYRETIVHKINKGTTYTLFSETTEINSCQYIVGYTYAKQFGFTSEQNMTLAQIWYSLSLLKDDETIIAYLENYTKIVPDMHFLPNKLWSYGMVSSHDV
jgi:TPR repeat protein